MLGVAQAAEREDGGARAGVAATRAEDSDAGRGYTNFMDIWGNFALGRV